MPPPATTTVTATCTLVSPSATACLTKQTLTPSQRAIDAKVSRNAGIATGIILAVYAGLLLACLIVWWRSRRRQKQALALTDEALPHMTVTPPSEAASKVALLSKPLPAVGVQDRGREREQSEKRGREHIQEPERPLLVRENRARSLSPVSNLSRYSHLAAEEEGAELADLRRREEGDGWERDHQRYESSISVNSTEQYYYPEYFGPEPTAGR